MDANKTILGTHGRVWLNNEMLAEVTKFECKVQVKYESMELNGMLCEQQRFTGYALSGTMNMKKIDSKILKVMKNLLANGEIPTIKIVGKMTDPNVKGSERVELYNVTIDEFTLASWENGKAAEENVPFHAGGFNILDTLEV